ncbi:MAG: cytochrome c peroxidase [bacterium]|nr:cytochrome c peroxidase [bacterium]
MRSKWPLILFLCLVSFAFLTTDKSHFEIPKNWPKPLYDFSKNPLSENKIRLGRALFYDPILSRDNTISCASCHSQFTAFAHVDHDLSHGINDQIGTRNAPALMNLAWQSSFMWDGAINHLDMQALAPISNPLEMDEKIEHVVSKLQHSNIYPQLFFNAFADRTITGEHTLKALSQFMLTLVSSNSKYDSVTRKQTSFTAQENKGYVLFKNNCASCHIEPLFSNFQFENNGLPIDPGLNDPGRMKISQNPNDSLKFKVPSLRNVEFSYPYMHDGRFKTLAEVLKHYTSGIQQSRSLSSKLQQQLVLTSSEKVDLIAFLLTLTDKQFLFDRRFYFPKIILSQTKDE